MGQEIKGFILKGYMERLFYRGKTYGKEFSMKKISDGIQKEIKQDSHNVKEKLHLKISIHSYHIRHMKWCVFKT